MASIGKLKKYQRKKFDKYKELNDLTKKGDEAYIYVRVKDLDSIISEFSSPERPTLNLDFVDLIERKASFIPLDLPLVLQIQNNNLTSTEKILVRKLIKNYFELKKVSKETEEHSLSRKGRFLFTTGILVASVLIALSSIEGLTFFKEILSVIASFSVWEYGGLMLFDYDDIREEIIKYNYLSKIRVIFDKDFK